MRPLQKGGFTVGDEEFADIGLRQEPGGRDAVLHPTDQRTPDGQPADEGTGAVDRIDHPARWCVKTDRTEFLADDSVIGKGRLDGFADDRLGLPVRFGHRIEPALQLVVDGKRLAKAGKGLPRRPSGEVAKELRHLVRRDRSCHDADILLMMPPPIRLPAACRTNWREDRPAARRTPPWRGGAD